MNKIILRLYLLLLPFLISQSCDDEPISEEDIFEITKSDILKNRNWTSKDITVWGIKLGMSKEEVEKILDSNKWLHYEIDKTHKTTDYRLTVYKKDKFKFKSIIYLQLIWSNDSDGLKEIIFFKNFRNNLRGESRNLIQEYLDDFHVEDLQKYLGLPNREEKETDLSFLKSTYYYYDSIGVKVHFQEIKKNSSNSYLEKLEDNKSLSFSLVMK